MEIVKSIDRLLHLLRGHIGKRHHECLPMSAPAFANTLLVAALDELKATITDWKL